MKFLWYANISSRLLFYKKKRHDMTKTLLIPTDFQIESLNMLKFALEEQTEPVKIILLYGNNLNGSISELLFYSRKSILDKLLHPSFRETLEILKNRFENVIHCISIELLNHNGSGLLRNLLEAHKVDVIYVPKSYKLRPGLHGFDPVPRLRAAGVVVRELAWSSPANEENHLQTLFVPATNLNN